MSGGSRDVRAPLAISAGDPAGVGPTVAVRAAIHCHEGDRLLLFGDAAQLARLFAAEGAGIRVRSIATLEVDALGADEIGLVDQGAVPEACIAARGPTAEGGRAQLAALDAAIAAVRAGRARGLVTAPISKEAVESTGTPFSGHTEHLARAATLRDDDVTMLFLGPRLRVALVTTHVAIARAPQEITQPRVARSIRHLVSALAALRDAGETRVTRLAVAGLNPHAGESGLFGDEERRVIAPALAAQAGWARAQGFDLVGPVPAETAFRQAADGSLAGVVAMLHDQATIASKLLDWGRAVNVTWGLPFVRTSVDHGVAYAAAASGVIDADGMIAALRLAQQLTRPR